ncbi:unnamed protein product, partial [marine sediment metagenome]
MLEDEAALEGGAIEFVSYVDDPYDAPRGSFSYDEESG